MFPVAFFLVLTALLLLGAAGGIAGVLLERGADASTPPWRRPPVRDVLFPVAGWGSLALLHLGVVLVGDETLDVRVKHLLAALALLLFYYAILATLRLIYRSARRVLARLGAGATPVRWRPLPMLGRLAFPTLFVSAVLAGITVYWDDGVSQNFVFIAGVAVLLMLPRKRPPRP